jgi:hypothetical protein
MTIMYIFFSLCISTSFGISAGICAIIFFTNTTAIGLY